VKTKPVVLWIMFSIILSSPPPKALLFLVIPNYQILIPYIPLRHIQHNEEIYTLPFIKLYRRTPHFMFIDHVLFHLFLLCSISHLMYSVANSLSFRIVILLYGYSWQRPLIYHHLSLLRRISIYGMNCRSKFGLPTSCPVQRVRMGVKNRIDEIYRPRYVAFS
jgi:hypothetical protein